ncbi:MAG: uncharacterized protein PWQ31_1025 [Eubacteriales bacterium]|nr:uncharacterized protein [Eubacteriales bacterium]
MPLTLDDIRKNPEIDIYFRKTNHYLAVQGVIDHDYAHAEAVAANSYRILKELGYPQRQCELAAIAGYLHDIGNVVNRHDHGRMGGIIAFGLLERMGMDIEEIAEIVGAIGNHEEKTGSPVSAISAAVIIADKADLHRSRVRKTDFTAFTVRDRVNYAVEASALEIDALTRTITLKLLIDLKISSVMEYFEIFMSRMVLSRRAAAFLGCNFSLYINDSKFL